MVRACKKSVHKPLSRKLGGRACLFILDGNAFDARYSAKLKCALVHVVGQQAKIVAFCAPRECPLKTGDFGAVIPIYPEKTETPEILSGIGNEMNVISVVRHPMVARLLVNAVFSMNGKETPAQYKTLVLQSRPRPRDLSKAMKKALEAEEPTVVI